jgi:hypothetical protein
MTDTELPTATLTRDQLPAGGQLTRHALHIANDTITRMGQQAIALRAELSAMQSDRDSLWNALYMPYGEIAQLRNTITELTQDNEILRGELASARTALGWVVA